MNAAKLTLEAVGPYLVGAQFGNVAILKAAGANQLKGAPKNFPIREGRQLMVVLDFRWFERVMWIQDDEDLAACHAYRAPTSQITWLSIASAPLYQAEREKPVERIVESTNGFVSMYRRPQFDWRTT